MYRIVCRWPTAARECGYFDVVFESHEKLSDAQNAFDIIVAGWIEREGRDAPPPLRLFVCDEKGEEYNSWDRNRKQS